MFQISQICWQNVAAEVFNGLWTSTHVLSDEPSHAWQSSVLLAQLGIGCSLRFPSAPDLPTTPGLGQQYYFYAYIMKQGPHRSSQGLFCCPQQSVMLCFVQIPALLACAFLFTRHPLPGHPQQWLRPHHKRSTQRAGCLRVDTKCL